MKPSIFILLFFAALALGSCKKNYTCDCELINTYKGVAPDSSYTRRYKNSSTPYDKKMTEKQAKAACDHEAESILSNYQNASAVFYAQLPSNLGIKPSPYDNYTASCTLK